MLIDPEDENWTFVVTPIGTQTRDKPEFEFRASSEPERVRWVKTFVSGCLLACDEDVKEDEASMAKMGLVAEERSTLKKTVRLLFGSRSFDTEGEEEEKGEEDAKDGHRNSPMHFTKGGGAD